MSSSGKTTQSINLSPEARTAFGREIGTFGNYALPRELQTRLELLQHGGPQGTSPFGEAIQKTSHVAQNATMNAGETRDVDPQELSQALMRLAERDPELNSRITEFGNQVIARTQSTIDPRFAQLYRPDVTSSTSPSGLSTGLAAGGLAVGVAALVIA